MGTTISDNTNATQLLDAVNNAFGNNSGIQEVSASDNAAAFVEKLNHNFDVMGTGGDAVFPTNTILPSDIGSLEQGEDIGGMSVADFIRYGINGDDRYMRFLHISDNHTNSSALSVANNLMANDRGLSFMALTGDWSGFGSFTYPLNSTMLGYLDGIGKTDNDPNGKLLLCPGNHDVYDASGVTSKQKACTDFIRGYLDDNVECGDETGIGSYFYKDYPLNDGRKLRVISVDQYETEAVRSSTKYYTMYSQKQVSWFIDTLKALTKDDFLIIMLHTPPFQWGYKENFWPYQTPDGYQSDQSSGRYLFVTEYLTFAGSTKGGKDDNNVNLIPRIVDAYMHKKTINFSYNNLGGSDSSPDVTVNADFSNTNPCTFLFYLCGHTHWDETYYLPDTRMADGQTEVNPCGGDWREQLMLCITAAGRGVSYAERDDLGGSGRNNDVPAPQNPSQETYRINEVTLDFAKRVITINRIGDMNTAQGRVRNTITFPFKRNLPDYEN